MRRVRSPYEVRSTRWERRGQANYESCRLFLRVGRPGAELAQEYSLAVTALPELLGLGGDFAVTDRAHIVASELDQERVRQYVTKLVQNCADLPESEARAVFERYFDADEHGRSAAQRRSNRVTVRGFDPPWFQSENDVSITFGVAEGSGGPDTELAVNAVTPKGLVARADAGNFILCHRATILAPSIDVQWLQQHIVDTVGACSGDLSVALPSLQRYYRVDWETSLSREGSRSDACSS